MTPGNQPINGRAWLDIHRYTLLSRQPDNLPELPIRGQHEQPLKRASPGAKRFTHGMEAVNHFRRIIVSIDWCHPAGPRS
jgi:hypothetical protein